MAAWADCGRRSEYAVLIPTFDRAGKISSETYFKGTPPSE